MAVAKHHSKEMTERVPEQHGIVANGVELWKEFNHNYF